MSGASGSAAPHVVGVGTVALDTVEAPSGGVVDEPGGSALYFAAAARHYAPVSVVGVTGRDYPEQPLARLAELGVDVSAIVRTAPESLRWRVRYDRHGRRETLAANRDRALLPPPPLSPGHRNARALFLGSTDPRIQRRVLDEAGEPGLVVVDTMAHWVRDAAADLNGVLASTDVLLVNEEELGLLAGGEQGAAAAAAVRERGPSWIVMKHGALGAVAYGAAIRLRVPAAGVEVVDPTGAGDAFAGGLVGSLAQGWPSGPAGREALARALRRAVVLGGGAVSSFGLEALLSSSRSEVDEKASTVKVTVEGAAG